MMKKYIYMEGGVDKFKTLPPIYGKIPMRWRDRHHIINGEVFEPSGADLLTSIDPFSDGSLQAKFRLDGDFSNVVGGGANITLGAVDTNRIYFDKSGPFASKSLNFMPQDTTTLSNNLVISNYIPNTVFTKGITISMFIKMTNERQLYGQNAGVSYTELFNFTTDFNNANGYGTLNNTIMNPALFFNFINNTFEIDRGVVYDANNQQSYLPYLNVTADANKLNTPNLPTTVFNKENKWIHVVYASDLYVEKLFVDGEKVLEVPSNKGMFQIPYGYFTLGSELWSNSIAYKQVELYNRKITDDEVLVLLNQKPKVFTVNPAIVYAEESNKLIYLNCDDDGNILSKGLEAKIGYNGHDKNLLSVDDKGNIVDSYGNNPFAGKVNRILQNTSYTQVNVTGATWGDFNTYEMDMNTDLYDYIIMLNNCVRLINIPINALGYAACVNINVGGESVVTQAPVGYNNGSNLVTQANNNSHHYVTTITPKITQGFVGRFKIIGSIAKYGPGIADTTWNVSNNLLSNQADKQPDSTRLSPDVKSDFIIYEIHKDNNTRY